MRTLFSLLLLSVAVFFASCKLEETITINADGSATINYEFALDREDWEDTGLGEEDALKDAQEPFRAMTQFMGKGVEFVNIDAVERLGGRGALIAEYRIADVNEYTHYNFYEMMMKINMTQFEEEEAAEEQAQEAKSSTTRFQLEGKKLTVTMPNIEEGQESPMLQTMREFADEDLSLDEMVKEMGEEMQEELQGGEIKRLLVLEEGIANTDADLVKDNQITLLNLPFDTLTERNELGLLVKQMYGMSGVEDMKKLNEMEGIEAETKPRFEVELK